MKAGSNRSDTAADAGSAVIVFDGVCALCNRWVRFLLRFFETNRLTPFAVYCCAVGAVLSIAFALT